MTFNKGSLAIELKMLYDIALDLFRKSCNNTGNIKSFLALPLHSPWYTPLPWICFSVLLPTRLDDREDSIQDYKRISISEFFTFGYPSFITDESSFDIVPFSSDQKGHATCILNFNGAHKKLTYNMRFDKSSGEP